MTQEQFAFLARFEDRFRSVQIKGVSSYFRSIPRHDLVRIVHIHNEIFKTNERLNPHCTECVKGILLRLSVPFFAKKNSAASKETPLPEQGSKESADKKPRARKKIVSAEKISTEK